MCLAVRDFFSCQQMWVWGKRMFLKIGDTWKPLVSEIFVIPSVWCSCSPTWLGPTIPGATGGRNPTVNGHKRPVFTKICSPQHGVIKKTNVFLSYRRSVSFTQMGCIRTSRGIILTDSHWRCLHFAGLALLVALGLAKNMAGMGNCEIWRVQPTKVLGI